MQYNHAIMIATIINCITVLVGSLIGLIFHAKIKDNMKEVVFISSGLIALLIGITMAMETGSYIGVMLAVAIGGMLGEALNIEGGILKLGGFFERMTTRKRVIDPVPREDETHVEVQKNFSLGFLNASVLFCVGALAIVGSIQAGAEGNYELILIKSVMDGFMAIMFTAAYGIGVAFSAVTILVYQGGLTLLAKHIAPAIGAQGLTELSAIGGMLVVMIGLNLLGVKKIKTGNFLPALLLVPVVTWLMPLIDNLIYSFSF